MESDAELPAEEAVDATRLLPQEDPGSLHRDDAEHWVEVYAELVAFKETILGEARHQRDRMDTDARGEVEATDLPVLEAEEQRIRRRLRFWRHRLHELSD